MNRRLPFLIWYFLVFIVAMPFNSSAQQLHFERLADKEGLYERTITCGLQDKTGFMWHLSEDRKGDTPVILCTGYSKKVFAREPKERGVDSILIKPIQRLELMNEMYSLLSA